DFNNPLAGTPLKYSASPVRKAKSQEERVRALIEMAYGLGEQFKIHLNDGASEIQLPDVCKTDEKWFVSKFRVVADLRELTELKTIRFVEEYEKKETKSEAAPLPEAKDAKADEKPATPAETKP